MVLLALRIWGARARLLRARARTREGVITISEHQGNPVKAVFDPTGGITRNYVATDPNIAVPDKKYDPLHGHINVNQQGGIEYRRDPGESR